MDNLFSTYPSTENRVAALDKLSREMGLGGFSAAVPAADTRSHGPWGMKYIGGLMKSVQWRATLL
jgi:heat shock protein HtpX